METSDKSVRRESRLAVFEHIVEKEKDCKRKKFESHRSESDDSSPSESELIIDDEVSFFNVILSFRFFAYA